MVWGGVLGVEEGGGGWKEAPVGPGLGVVNPNWHPVPLSLPQGPADHIQS